jgi:putative oxidoreductase
VGSLENIAQGTTPVKYAIHTTRILLGALCTFSGLNVFCHFTPIPQMQGDPGAFIGAILHSGYIYPIGALQLLGGLCLMMASRFVPLGLTLLGPVIFNIVLYHIFLDRTGLPIAAVVALLALFLLWVYRYKFPAIFQP